MSEAAKERVIALGTQFNSMEHSSADDPTMVTFSGESGSPRKSFWKRNTSKLPGSIKPAHGAQELLSSTSTSVPSTASHTARLVEKFALKSWELVSLVFLVFRLKRPDKSSVKF